VSVNYDARIKETVTPGEKKTRKSERTTDSMGEGMEEGGPVKVERREKERERERERERKTNLWRFRSCK